MKQSLVIFRRKKIHFRFRGASEIGTLCPTFQHKLMFRLSCKNCIGVNRYYRTKLISLKKPLIECRDGKEKFFEGIQVATFVELLASYTIMCASQTEVEL